MSSLSRFVVFRAPPSKAVGDTIKRFFAPLILLKKYPRSLIQINLQTLSKPTDRWTRGFTTESAGEAAVELFEETQSVAEKAALINAASLALLDAGVCMRGCAFAVGVAIIPSSRSPQHHPTLPDLVVLDPCPAEESAAKSLHLVGLHFGHQFNAPSGSSDSFGKVALCESNGSFTYDQLQTVIKYASLATQQILAFVRQSCEIVYQQQEEYDPSELQPSAPHADPAESRKKKKTKKNK